MTATPAPFPARSRLGPIALAALLNLSGAGFALAQSDTDSEAKPQDRKSTFGESALSEESGSGQILIKEAERAKRRGLDEIIVTAQKKEQDIREVPISVSAMSGEALKDQNIQDFSDLAKYTPNLSVLSSGPFNEVAIRGLGSGLMEGFEQSVGLIIDDVYYGRVHYLTMAFLDVKQVEVLRGPQGTLFGKNTIAGALTIRTNDPGPEWEADLTGELGTYERRNIKAAVNVPIIEDRLAIRVAGMHNERAGFVFNTYLDEDDGRVEQDLIRGKIALDITETTDLVLSATYNRHLVPQGAGIELSAVGTGLGVLSELFDPDVEFQVNRQGSFDQRGYTDQSNTDVSARLRTSLFGLDFTLVANHSIYERENILDADFSPVPIIQLDQFDEYDQTTIELRVSGDTDFGSWGDGEFIGGVYLFDSHLEASQYIQIAKIDNLGVTLADLVPDLLLNLPVVGTILQQSLNTPGISATLESRDTLLIQDTQSVAGFGQFTWHIQPWISLVGGLRISFERKEGSQFAQNYELEQLASPGLIIQPLLGAQNIDVDDLSRDEFELSPKVSVIWRATDDINIYATYAKGFKAGGFNTQALTAAEIEFEPEESDTFELGLKAEFLDGVGRVNFGLFRTQFKNLQTFIFNGLAPVVDNAAASVSQGIELEGGAVLPLGFFVGGSFSVLDAYYTEYENGPCKAGQSGFCDLSGERLGAPRYQMTFIADYTTALFNWPIELVIGGDLYFQSKQFLQSDLDPADMQDAYYVLNLRAALKDMDGQWDISLFVRNVMDKTTITRSFDIALFTGSHWARTNDPRTISVQASMSF